MKNINFRNVKLTDGFWYEKQKMIQNVTIESVYNRFLETYRFEALKCMWKEGDPNQPHIFWDSDVAKWIEGAAYSMHIYGRDEHLEKIIDECVDLIEKNSDENGYFNSHFLVVRQDERFCHRTEHELYCLGHLIEAAIAYYETTGKDKFLRQMCKYTDYVEKVFKIEKSAGFVTPGHPELELALVRLYKATDEKRYLELAKYFIDMHGSTEKNNQETLYDFYTTLYNQDEMPLVERTTAEGHCVRAMYLMAGAADIASIYGHTELIEACERVFDNVVNKRMYITGGIGSTHIGEAFTIDYHLPNRVAYAETCAALSLALFAGRMQEIKENSKYADTIERVIYNGFLSGISMDGKSFFYENPLEIDPDFNNVNISTNDKERYAITERVEVFNCSCCPPNILRFMTSISNFTYTSGCDTLYVQQYMTSEAEFEGNVISQKTNYPVDGKVEINYIGNKKYLALRIPDWCKSFNLNTSYTLRNGYAIIEISGETKVVLHLDMPVSLIMSNRRVHDNAGRVAVMRGPVVYCIEGVDNGKDLKNVHIDINGNFTLEACDFILPAIKTVGYRDKATDELYYTAVDDYEEFPLTLIPYFAFANRGTTEMQVWILKK